MNKRDEKAKQKTYYLIENVAGVETIKETRPYEQEGFTHIDEKLSIGFIKVNGKWQKPEPQYDYAESRAREYRNGDYIDAIMKEMNYRRAQGEKMTQPMDDALGHWLQVKENHPKDNKAK